MESIIYCDCVAEDDRRSSEKDTPASNSPILRTGEVVVIGFN